MVVNAILVAAVVHANETGDPMIYHVGSSVRNPVRFTALHEVAYNYFTKHPWIDKDGNPIIVGHVKVLGSMASFKRYLTLRYLVPLKVGKTSTFQCTLEF